MIDLDTLTLGQLRTLRADIDNLLTPKPTAMITAIDSTPNPYSHLIGRSVIVRSRGSGVWAAMLDAAYVTAAGVIVSLSYARRLWSWQGAGECSSLALTGPSGGKIGPACSVTVAEVLEVHAMTPAAVSAVSAVAPWTK